jgi:hypothetical protein
LALTSSMTLLGRDFTMSNHFAGEHRIAGGWMRRFFLFASSAEPTSSPHRHHPLSQQLHFGCLDSDQWVALTSYSALHLFPRNISFSLTLILCSSTGGTPALTTTLITGWITLRTHYKFCDFK